MRYAAWAAQESGMLYLPSMSWPTISFALQQIWLRISPVAWPSTDQEITMVKFFAIVINRTTQWRNCDKRGYSAWT